MFCNRSRPFVSLSPPSIIALFQICVSEMILAPRAKEHGRATHTSIEDLKIRGNDDENDSQNHDDDKNYYYSHPC